MEANPDYVTKTTRGGDKVIYQGHAYIKDRNGPEDVSYWRCELQKEFYCRGRLKMAGQKIVALLGSHNHAGEAARKEVAMVRDRITALSQETAESISEIVTIVLAEASGRTLALLPPVKSLERQAQRERARAHKAVCSDLGILVELQSSDKVGTT